MHPVFTIFSKNLSRILRIKQVPIAWFLSFVWEIIRRFISAEQGISRLFLIRRHPDLNWGKRICSPPPYHSAMPPKWYPNRCIFPVLLNCFSCTWTFSSVFIHPPFYFLKKLPIFFYWLDPLLPSISKRPTSFTFYWILKNQL